MTPPERAELSDPADGILGEWVVVTYHHNGKDHDDLSGVHLTFTRDKAFTRIGAAPFGCRLDRSAWPPRIDLIHPDGTVQEGIYVCMGDRLIWADQGRDEPRPKSFTPEAGSRVWVYRLRRVK